MATDLDEQQTIVEMHLRLVETGHARDRDHWDKKCFEDLKKVSPEKLTPVLVRPCGWFRDMAYFAAYLIGATPGGGCRLLYKERDRWRITRVKGGADVIRVNGVGRRGAHAQIVTLQAQSNDLMKELIKWADGERDTSRGKATSRATQKSKRPTGKNS